MLRQLEEDFKVISMESRKGMVLIVAMKEEPKEKVYQIFVRKLENLNDFLATIEKDRSR